MQQLRDMLLKDLLPNKMLKELLVIFTLNHILITH